MFTKKIGAKKVAVLFWIIDSIIPAAIVQKVRSKNKLFAKCLIVSALANLVMSIGAYSYYIGYSRQAFWAIGWGITRNGIYFSVISMISAVLITVYFCTKNWDRGRTRSYRNNKEFGSFLMKTDKVLLDKLLLIIAVLVSLAVRLIGFWWGNGVTFHPDEGNMVREPMRMAQEGSLMSQAVFYPAQVSHKILSICFKGYEIICSIFDIEFSTVWCYYIGRIYIALLSAGIVVCIFFHRKLSETPCGNCGKLHGSRFSALCADSTLYYRRYCNGTAWLPCNAGGICLFAWHKTVAMAVCNVISCSGGNIGKVEWHGNLRIDCGGGYCKLLCGM